MKVVDVMEICVVDVVIWCVVWVIWTWIDCVFFLATMKCGDVDVDGEDEMICGNDCDDAWWCVEWTLAIL